MDQATSRRIFEMADRASKIAWQQADFSAVFEVAQRFQTLSMPALQRQWVDNLPNLDLARIAYSPTAEQIQSIVTTYSGLNAANVIQTRLLDLPDQLLQSTMAESLRRIESVVSQATTIALYEAATRLHDERLRTADRAIRDRGWFPFASWSDPELIAMGAYAVTDSSRAFSRRLLEMYRRNRLRGLRRMVAGWEDVETFRNRRSIVREALLSHRDRRYRVAVPALIPLVEGIVSDEFPTPQKRKVHKNVREQLEKLPELHEIETTAITSALDALYKDYDRTKLSRSATDLNRHMIMHGHILNYGSAANSLRAFSILDMLHAQVQTAHDIRRAA